MDTPFDIKLSFSGLCLFHTVPKEDAASNDPTTDAEGSRKKLTKKATVLLVNTERAAPCKPVDDCRKDKNSILVQHTPCLRFRRSDWQNPDGKNEEWVERNLLGTEVTIGTGGGLTTVNYERISGGHKVPRTNDADDLSGTQWIADLQDVLRHAGITPQLRSDCLIGPLPNDGVASRIHLTEGTLQSVDVGRDRKKKPILWYFWDKLSNTHETPHTQALTEQFDLRIKQHTGTFQVTITKNNRPEPIKLAPRSGHTLELSITNLPAKCDEALTESPHSLVHFRWFYELLATCPSVQPAPYSDKIVVKLLESKLGKIPLSRGALLKLLSIKHILNPGPDGNAFCPPASWNE